MKIVFIAFLIILTTFLKVKANVIECQQIKGGNYILCQDNISSGDNVKTVIAKSSVEYFNTDDFKHYATTMQDLIKSNI